MEMTWLLDIVHIHASSARFCIRKSIEYMHFILSPMLTSDSNSLAGLNEHLHMCYANVQLVSFN